MNIVMTGQLNQVSNNSRQNNELSDDDVPDLQQIFISSTLVKPKVASKIKTNQIEIQTPI